MGDLIMRRRHAAYVAAAVLVFLPLSILGSSAGAQTDTGVTDLPLGTQSPRAAWLDVFVLEILLSEGLLLLMVALGCGVFFAGMEAIDSWRERRAGEVAWLRTRIVTALQRDRLLRDLPVTPIVHPPLWGRSGATVELRGQVPTPWLHYAVLRTAELAIAKNVTVYHIDDRLVTVLSGEARAA